MNRKKYFIALGVVIGMILLFLVNGGRVIPPTIVEYYGQVMDLEQLERESFQARCTGLSYGTLESFYRYWTYQPDWICFDTNYELDQWMRANQLIR